MTEEEKEKALRIAYDNGLYISGGSDHDGLCCGYYKEDGNEKNNIHYAQYLSYGTTKEHFEEIKTRKLLR